MACKNGMCGRRATATPAPRTMPQSYAPPAIAPQPYAAAQNPLMQNYLAQTPQINQPYGSSAPVNAPTQNSALPNTGGFGALSQNLLQPAPISGKSVKSKGGIGSFFMGSKPQELTYSNYSPYQQQALNGLLQNGIGGIQNPYAGFDELQSSIMRQYLNNILPEIAGRFQGGALSSPDFAKQLGTGAQGLAEQLFLHKLNYGNQNRQFGLQQAQLGLQPQYERAYTPGKEGFFSGLANRAIPAAAKVLSGGFL